MSQESYPDDILVDVDKRADGPGVTRIDDADPAAPMYRVLSKLRSPVALRDLMIHPVRYGYAGQDLPDFASVIPPWEAMFPEVSVSEIRVPSAAGPIRCQVYRPERGEGNRPVVIYCHGGGFMVGCSEDTDYMTRRICSTAGVVVVSVNYRLAPEWPFPAGIDDCLEVYRWARSHAGEVGGDSSKVGVAGDSSGGNFAAALPLRARDEGVPLPDATVMFGPVVDMRLEEYAGFEEMAVTGFVYDAAFFGFLRGAYCRFSQWNHPHVSPIRADLRGYPPALIVVGTHDPIFSSCRAFTESLRGADVETELHVADGMPHGFYFWPGVFAAEQEAAYDKVAKFLQRHLGRTGK